MLPRGESFQGSGQPVGTKSHTSFHDRIRFSLRFHPLEVACHFQSKLSFELLIVLDRVLPFPSGFKEIKLKIRDAPAYHADPLGTNFLLTTPPILKCNQARDYFTLRPDPVRLSLVYR